MAKKGARPVKQETLYRASEFAKLVGVTVRTLHHYDRLGLLKPGGRTRAGYRLYGERELERLQQIVTLKFLGLPLREIKSLLSRQRLDVATTLRLQRALLEEKRRRVELALRAVGEAENTLRSRPLAWEDLRKIVEVIEMQSNTEWMKRYYTPEQLKSLESRSHLAERGQQDWAELIRDVEVALARGEDPAGAAGQALAERQRKLIEQFTGGDPGILKGLKSLYSDQGTWPADFKRPYSDEVGTFLCQAAAARRK